MILYLATGKKCLANPWTLQVADPNTTHVTMGISTDFAYAFLVLIGWSMKRLFNAVPGELIVEFGYFFVTACLTPRMIPPYTEQISFGAQPLLVPPHLAHRHSACVQATRG